MECKSTILVAPSHTDQPPIEKNAVALIQTTKGRDKIYRCIQFFSKFILPSIREKHPEFWYLVPFLEKLCMACDISRGLNRIGMIWVVLKRLKERIRAIRNKVQGLKSCAEFDAKDLVKPMADVAFCGFYFFDHIALLGKIKAIELEMKTQRKAEFYSYVAWGFENILTLTDNVFNFIRLKRRVLQCEESMEVLENKESIEYKTLLEQAVREEREKEKLQVDIYRCAADLPVTLHYISGGQIIPPWICGLLGTLSSSIAIYQLLVERE